MANPTFSFISPSSGQVGGGQIVTITGTNFRTRAVSYTYPPTSTKPTMAVYFDGQKAENVYVASSTKLYAQVPPYLGDANALQAGRKFAAVDVKIENLDDSGTLISGETYTRSGFYTYTIDPIRLPEDEAPLQAVHREWIQMCKRSLLYDIQGGDRSRVSMRVHTDYSPGDTDLWVEIAKLPAIRVGFTVERDEDYKLYDNEQILVANGSTWDLYDAPLTVKLKVPMLISARFEMEAQQMIGNFLDMKIRQPWVILNPDSRYPGATDRDGFPWEITKYPRQASKPSRVNVCAYDFEVEIYGIPVMSKDPIQKVFPATTLYLTDTDIEGKKSKTTTV